jgi:signal peptidase II
MGASNAALDHYQCAAPIDDPPDEWSGRAVSVFSFPAQVSCAPPALWSNARSMTSNQRRALLLMVVAASIGCDQATKRVALVALEGQPTHSLLADTLRLTFARNPGAFLSLGAGLPGEARFWSLTVALGLLLLLFLAYLWRTKKLNSLQLTACALIAGGGISNWVDRALSGAVIDFLNLGIGSLRTGVFNLADVAIMIGIGTLLADSFKPAPART